MQEMQYKEIDTDIRQLKLGVEIKSIFNCRRQNSKSISHPGSEAAGGSAVPYVKLVSASICPFCKEKLTS